MLHIIADSLYIHFRACTHVTGGEVGREVGGWGRDPKNVRGEVRGWGRVPFNEPYAPSLRTIYDGA